MKVDKKTVVRQFGGRIVGYIEEDNTTGEARCRDFYGRILGTYQPGVRGTGNKNTGVTRDFYGRIVGEGNQLQGLIWNPQYNKSL